MLVLRAAAWRCLWQAGARPFSLCPLPLMAVCAGAGGRSGGCFSICLHSGKTDGNSPTPLLLAVSLFSANMLLAQSLSRVWLWDPMDCSTPGFPVLHYLPEFDQTHVHWVGDAIQPSHPLAPPFPLALNLSQHQDLFQWVGSSHQVASLGASALASVLPMNTQGWFPLGWTGLISLLMYLCNLAAPMRMLQVLWLPETPQNNTTDGVFSLSWL